MLPPPLLLLVLPPLLPAPLPELPVPALAHAPEATQAPASEPDWWCGLSDDDALEAADADDDDGADEVAVSGNGLSAADAEDECASDKEEIFECDTRAADAAALVPCPPNDVEAAAAEVDTDRGPNARACALAAFSCTNCTRRSTDTTNPTPKVRANPA